MRMPCKLLGQRTVREGSAYYMSIHLVCGRVARICSLEACCMYVCGSCACTPRTKQSPETC